MTSSRRLSRCAGVNSERLSLTKCRTSACSVQNCAECGQTAGSTGAPAGAAGAPAGPAEPARRLPQLRELENTFYAAQACAVARCAGRADAQNTQSGQFRYAMGPITNELTAEILLNRSFIGALKALE